MIPEYVICADCESPCYTFEWQEEKVAEAVCNVCGNEDAATFLTEDEFDAFSSDSDWRAKYNYYKRPLGGGGEGGGESGREGG